MRYVENETKIFSQRSVNMKTFLAENAGGNVHKKKYLVQGVDENVSLLAHIL